MYKIKKQNSFMYSMQNCHKANQLYYAVISYKIDKNIGEDKMKFRALVCVLMLCFCLIIPGCSKNSSIPENKSAEHEKLIVTSFYPIYIFTLNVADNIKGVKVVNMTRPQTGCLHDYSITPDDLKLLEKTDIFVINGAGMESFMDRVIKGQPHLKIVDSSSGITLLRDKNTGEPNPHIWLSISNAVKQVNNIAEQLALYDPENAAAYKKNADIYVKKLTAQKDKMHKELDNIKTREIITFHEAFPYFAKEFNLVIADVIEREPGSEPSAGELKETIDIVKKLKISALFAEPQYPAKAAQIIAKETGSKIYTLDPIVTGENNKDLYIKIMDDNLNVLKEALK